MARGSQHPLTPIRPRLRVAALKHMYAAAALVNVEYGVRIGGVLVQAESVILATTRMRFDQAGAIRNTLPAVEFEGQFADNVQVTLRCANDRD